MPTPFSMGSSTKPTHQGEAEVGIDIDISSLVSVLRFSFRTLWLTFAYLPVSKKEIPQQVLKGWEQKPLPGGKKDPRGKAVAIPKSMDEETAQGPSKKRKKAKKGLRITRTCLDLC